MPFVPDTTQPLRERPLPFHTDVRCGPLTKVHLVVVLLLLGACNGPVMRALSPSSGSLGIADSALRGGSAPVAMQITDAVLASSPDNAAALEVRGDALTALGQYDTAQVVFGRALRANPSSIRARIGLGRLLLGSDPGRAEVVFLEVYARDPRDAVALNNLGIARDLQGRHEDAQLAYRQALGVNPDLRAAQVNLALSLEAARRQTAASRSGRSGRPETFAAVHPLEQASSAGPISLMPQ